VCAVLSRDVDRVIFSLVEDVHFAGLREKHLQRSVSWMITFRGSLRAPGSMGG
jgi:hypothetical protein